MAWGRDHRVPVSRASTVSALGRRCETRTLGWAGLRGSRMHDGVVGGEATEVLPDLGRQREPRQQEG